MDRSSILPLLVAAVLLVPAATAGVGTGTDSAPTGDVGEPTSEDAAAQAGGESSGGGSADAASNYTALYVADRYRSLELKPGESGEVSVTVENGEDEPVTVRPRLHTPEVGQRPVEADWVSVDTDGLTLAPGESATVNATVAVPEDAELARYAGSIAFTNETISRAGRPARPLHAAQVDVEVYEEPTVFVRSGDWARLQAKAGDSVTHEVVVENTGDSAVPVDPEVVVNDRVGRSGDGDRIERSWFSIDAPAEVGAGETATVEVAIDAPAEADSGRYDAQLNLGIRDPNRQDRNGYWQEVDVSLEVWSEPDGPFEASFDVAAEADEVTLRLTTDDRRSGDDAEPGFDVSFAAPNGTTIDAERVERRTSGHVSLADTETRGDGDYGARASSEAFVYRIDRPAAGEWTARITPENVIDFGYEVVRSEG